MSSEDYTSRDWATHDEDQETFRQERSNAISSLMADLNINNQELGELVWKYEIDKLRSSGKISEEWIRSYEAKKDAVKDFGTMMDALDAGKNPRVQEVLGQVDPQDLDLIVLKKEKETRGSKK